MSRPVRPRLSVVRAEPVRADERTLELEIAREKGIRLAAEGLFKAAHTLCALPRLPEVADYRAGASERFEAAVKVMKEALSDA